MAAAMSVQDRTPEFQSILTQARKRLASSKTSSQRQFLLSDAQRSDSNASPPNGTPAGGKRAARSEFARRAAEIGRGISGTMVKLQRLAMCESIILRGIMLELCYLWCIWDKFG